MSLSIDPSGAFALIAENSGTIHKVDIQTKDVTSLVGMKETYGFQDGVGSQARFQTALDVAINPNGGNFALVADTKNCAIQKN